MIRPLRQRHRVTVGLLGVVLPIVVVVSIAARRAVPVMTTLPATVAGVTPAYESVVWDRAELWTPRPIRTRLLADQADRFAVELSRGQAIARADLLVYWTRGERSPGETLPEDAILLGAFAPPVVLPLPAGAVRQPGALILYTLADHEIVACTKPLTF